ncbi:MAG: LytR C-terminal domain-containing protein [Candidatus Chisholmbacteria bacterium]|nr:LytR C-terminal domain-containing protein [Candidatus Chisholmbacteria bacterium]
MQFSFRPWGWVGVGVGVVGLAIGGYFFYQNRQLKVSNEVVGLVEKVGRLVALPEGEEPVVATVTEREKLSGQPFFAKAQNGDKVLIYTGAKKAYLYDSDSDRVLEIASLTLGTEASESGEARERAYTFAVRNGAGVAGIAGQFAEMIEEKVEGATVVETSNAVRTDYEASRLVSFIGDEVEAKRVAELLGVNLGDLPEGEVKPEADFLVVVGRDQG